VSGQIDRYLSGAPVLAAAPPRAWRTARGTGNASSSSARSLPPLRPHSRSRTRRPAPPRRRCHRKRRRAAGTSGPHATAAAEAAGREAVESGERRRGGEELRRRRRWPEWWLVTLWPPMGASRLRAPPVLCLLRGVCLRPARLGLGVRATLTFGSGLDHPDYRIGFLGLFFRGFWNDCVEGCSGSSSIYKSHLSNSHYTS
jgi:hypothetical protein